VTAASVHSSNDLVPDKENIAPTVTAPSSSSIYGRPCPRCDHTHTKRESKNADGERWRCMCRDISSCRDCPNCKQACITNEDCVCKYPGQCTCSKAKPGNSNRICVQMECAYVSTFYDLFND